VEIPDKLPVTTLRPWLVRVAQKKINPCLSKHQTQPRDVTHGYLFFFSGIRGLPAVGIGYFFFLKKPRSSLSAFKNKITNEKKVTARCISD